MGLGRDGYLVPLGPRRSPAYCRLEFEQFGCRHLESYFHLLNHLKGPMDLNVEVKSIYVNVVAMRQIFTCVALTLKDYETNLLGTSPSQYNYYRLLALNPDEFPTSVQVGDYYSARAKNGELKLKSLSFVG